MVAIQRRRQRRQRRQRLQRLQRLQSQLDLTLKNSGFTKAGGQPITWRNTLALFIQKPIFWNTNQYIRPSGARATSGYPKQWGYGHEEWNNSPRFEFKDSGRDFRAFHTEKLGNAPLLENAGQTFVFLTASHHGIQQLVGIAGNAFGMMDETLRPKRRALAERLDLQSLFDDVWSVEAVRKLHNKRTVKEQWDSELGWLTNWVCPAEYYMWFDEPITIDAMALTGKKRLLGMYGSYTELNLSAAHRFLNIVPIRLRDRKWSNLADAISCAPIEPVGREEILAATEPVTTMLTKVNARRGQGKFRSDLFQIWGNACAVTGLTQSELLIASHVKPWEKSSNRERLDPENGLLLIANLDALFDSGLITFGTNGRMQISSLVDNMHRTRLQIPSNLRMPPSERLSSFLEYHRKNLFRH